MPNLLLWKAIIHLWLDLSRASQQMNLQCSKITSSKVTMNTVSLTLDQVKEEFGDVFKGQGYMDRKTSSWNWQDSYTSDQSTSPSPLTLKEKLKSQLGRLEGLEMIQKVKEPTDWVSGLVVVEKPNGKLRICTDPVHLNRALKRSHYSLPVTEDVLSELADVKVFSEADLKDGFLPYRAW